MSRSFAKRIETSERHRGVFYKCMKRRDSASAVESSAIRNQGRTIRYNFHFQILIEDESFLTVVLTLSCTMSCGMAQNKSND